MKEKDWTDSGTTLTVTLKGNALFVERSGQPTVELIPYKGTEFTIKGREGSSVKFILENGAVTEIVMGSRYGSVRGKKTKIGPVHPPGC